MSSFKCMSITCFYFWSADPVTDPQPNKFRDPEWCEEARPDCNVAYTKQQCKNHCISMNGK